MPSRRVPILAVTAIALLLTAGLLPAPATAQSDGDERVMHWDYEIAVDDPASGRVDVTIHFRNVGGLVERIVLFTENHQHPISDVTSTHSRLRGKDGNVELVVENRDEWVRFTVDVNRPANRDDEFNAYLGNDWGVFKAEAFALGFRYVHLSGEPFRWESRVRFDLPYAWRAEMPLPRASADTFTLPEGTLLPRGFIALGPFETVTHEAAGKEFRYARLGEKLEYEDEMFPYLEAATPYYERVYGNTTDDVILAVSGAGPMFRGGLGGANSLFVHDETELRTFAHEYAHVWQAFNTVPEEGRASVWIAEGDADYHGALSLFTSGHWSLGDVNAFLEDFHGRRHEAPYKSTPLTHATYGTEAVDVAYHKGALVLHALDLRLKETSGDASLTDVLQALNRERDQRVQSEDEEEQARRISPVTNPDFLDLVERVTGWTGASSFFDRYVYGTSYPDFEPVTRNENMALTGMTVTPESPREGEAVTVTVHVENRGISDASKSVPLFLNGEIVATRNVSLRVGHVGSAVFDFPAPGPGTHQLRSHYLEEWFDVLRPARFEVERATLVPRAPAVGEQVELIVYVRNAGDLPGDARVVADLPGGTRLGEGSVEVAGNGTRAVSFPVQFHESGSQSVRIRLPPADVLHTFEVRVEEEDVTTTTPPGGPGGSPLQDLFNEIPAPGALVAAALLAAAAVVGRGRARER